MMILGRKFDWDPWPGQITFIAPSTVDGDELDLPSTRSAAIATMPCESIAVRWFCTEEDPCVASHMSLTDRAGTGSSRSALRRSASRTRSSRRRASKAASTPPTTRTCSARSRRRPGC